ncbi:Photosystem II protein D1 [Capsicum baccatum]|uniref:Photosystem II protein D1 n=1 Tax=Capsicum baccatum TaxID=33114 RepID=A0A2G2WTB6_CAPBA|nr:Photosystem II protein D1 [Capsicum baccatum]
MPTHYLYMYPPKKMNKRKKRNRGLAGVKGVSLFSVMHASLVTSSLIRESTENESANEGYRFGQEEET